MRMITWSGFCINQWISTFFRVSQIMLTLTLKVKQILRRWHSTVEEGPFPSSPAHPRQFEFWISNGEFRNNSRDQRATIWVQRPFSKFEGVNAEWRRTHSVVLLISKDYLYWVRKWAKIGGPTFVEVWGVVTAASSFLALSYGVEQKS